MWHVCEEALATVGEQFYETTYLDDYCKKLYRKYPMSQDEIQHWHGVCKTLFPVYVHYTKKYQSMPLTPVLSEQVFDVPYTLPSGRTVRLRGKWDSVHSAEVGSKLRPRSLLFLQENKTKGDVDAVKIGRQIKYDLQTMLYLVALSQDTGIDSLEEMKGPYGDAGAEGLKFKCPIGGVLYNVVKRPRHYQGKKESRVDFLTRLCNIVEDTPQDFFARWKIEITEADITRFRRECLDPILEQLCDWWEYVNLVGVTDGGDLYDPNGSGVWSRRQAVPHWRHPFGIFNTLDEGGCSDLDDYLDTGSTVGLVRGETLFPELEGQ